MTDDPARQRGPAIEIVSAGTVTADCVARPVRDLPAPGKLALVEQICLELGGSAANTGAQLVRLGQRVLVAGRVGNDNLGRAMREELRRLGTESKLETDPHTGTSATLVQVDKHGERSFLHSVGANAHISAQDFQVEDWRARGAKVLHVAGYYVLPTLEAQLPELFARTTKLGLTTSLDCAWNPAGPWERLHAALPHTDIFCPSLTEAQQITGLRPPLSVAERLLDLGVRQVVALKMGEHGSFLLSRDGEAVYTAAPQIVPLDGTGGGDSFIAGLLSGFLRGLTWAECARLGNAAGGLCVSALGGTGGIGSFGQVERLAASLSQSASLPPELPWPSVG